MIPDQDPQWNCQNGGLRSGTQKPYDNMPHRKNEKFIIKPVNYDKMREITQGRDENLALFQGCLMEALRKFTNVDPTSREGQMLLGTHFISQSAPYIRRKLQKTALGHQTPMN